MTKIGNNKTAITTKVEDKKLLKEAFKALKLSYAPYSNFAVGAAILKSNSKMYKGANIENASYPLCLCAERTAIAHAHSADPRSKIRSIAVVCKSAHHKVNATVSPCGACRQVISEFEEKQKSPIRIILSNDNGSEIKIFDSIKELLPHSFDSSYLI